MLRGSFYFLLLVGFGLLLSTCALPAEDENVLQPKIGILGWRMSAFDIAVEAVFFSRHDHLKRIDFTAQGVGGDVVLSSSQLDLGWVPGWRVSAEVIFDNCDRIEASYLSSAGTSDSKKVKSGANDLYSIFSSYGAHPLGGYFGTDQAALHAIKYQSDFYTWEANYRDHLSLFEIPCLFCLEGSLLYGYRYFSLQEEFHHFTQSVLNNASFDGKVDVRNSMHGLQAGVEAWLPFSERLDLAVEAKAAYYLNCYHQNTKIIAEADLGEPIADSKDNWGAVWGFEGSVKVSFEVTRNLYLRVGYLLLRLDNVAVAPRNYNTRSPFKKNGDTKVCNGDSVTYHGATIGCDLCW